MAGVIISSNRRTRLWTKTGERREAETEATDAQVVRKSSERRSSPATNATNILNLLLLYWCYSSEDMTEYSAVIHKIEIEPPPGPLIYGAGCPTTARVQTLPGTNEFVMSPAQDGFLSM